MQFDQIQAEEIIVGKNVVIEPGAIIRGLTGKANKIMIGDNTFIGRNVQIICNDFSIGDYCSVHQGTHISGYTPCNIGHNAWIGQFSIIDSIGGVTIGNNCGIGAQSQLWSHIRYGDTLEGCRFMNESPLQIGNDVWFVGHCIVSPIIAADKSMALAGSVITKNMEYNTVYAGSPAQPISDKIGPQFRSVTVEEKKQKMDSYLEQWGGNKKTIQIITSADEIAYPDEITYFNVATRTYNKRLSESEIGFMRFLLHAKAKFIPALTLRA